MSQSKRVSAPKNCIPSLSGDSSDVEENLVCDDNDVSDSTPFVAFLSHITDGCSVRDIDPTACIPLYLARGHSENAVQLLKTILNGNASEPGIAISLTGMVSGTPTSIVVPLIGYLLYLLEVHLEEKHKNQEDRQAVKGLHDVWYGIIDGSHVHCAIIELGEELPLKWGNFKWKVFVVRSSHQLSEYRKLSVVQNKRNKQVYHYETTLYDILNNLRRIYDELYTKHKKVSRHDRSGVSVLHKDVSEMYDGGKHTKHTTVRQVVSVASRISSASIEAIGVVANKPCPGIILNNGKLNTHKLTSAKSILARYDCLLFRQFLCTSTLRGAQNFMNAVKDGNEIAQINTVYRERHWSERNDFRSVNPSVLSDLFKMSMKALKEEKKFLVLIGECRWPTEMITNKENLLRTTIYDNDIESNVGNESDVLPELWNSFCRKYPGTAKGIEDAKKKAEADNSPNVAPSEPPPIPESHESAGDAPDEDALKRAEDEKKRLEEERRVQLRVQADVLLMKSSIVIHELHFEEFARDVWSDKGTIVYLVLSAVPSDARADTLVKLPPFVKSVLKTGSYVFLIVNEVQLITLQQSFRDAGFKVCEHPFTILYDTTTMRKRKSGNFPQRHFDIALISKTQGMHPDGFIPDFASSAMSDDAEHDSSTFASFTDVANCDKKLKAPGNNIALFPEYRSVELYKRVIRLLAPTEGTLIDPFGGPLSAGLACLETGRGCIAMDKTSNCLKLALGRLRVYATPEVTMADHEVYSGTLIAGSASDDDEEAEKDFVDPKSSAKKRRTESCAHRQGQSVYLEVLSTESAQQKTSRRTSGLDQTTTHCFPSHQSLECDHSMGRRSTRLNTINTPPCSAPIDDNDETDVLLDAAPTGNDEEVDVSESTTASKYPMAPLNKSSQEDENKSVQNSDDIMGADALLSMMAAP